MMPLGFRRQGLSLAIGPLALAVAGCAAAATPEPEPVAMEPPAIEFAGIVTDVRIYADHIEYSDPAGVVHAVDPDAHRDVAGNGWSGPLLVHGNDANGAFVASFMNQDGLPADCYVENDVGTDRGSHIAINGVLWKKSPAFDGGVPFGQPYPLGTRFCFDESGTVASLIER